MPIADEEPQLSASVLGLEPVAVRRGRLIRRT